MHPNASEVQGHPPFLKVPWDWKEVVAVSFLFRFFREMRAITQVRYRTSQHANKHMHDQIGAMQVFVLWLLSTWILGYWVLPTMLEFAGYCPDDLSSRGQALMHVIVDFGQLGLTFLILNKRLKAYRPWHLGWFRSYWQPIHKWLGPVLCASGLFPLLASVAEQAQVGCSWRQP